MASIRPGNHLPLAGVIIKQMRRRGRVIHMVAMLALLMASLPLSAIASLFSPTCSMPCCAGKPTHMVDDPNCANECDELAGHHSLQGDSHSTGHHAKAEPADSDHIKLAVGPSLAKVKNEGCKCTIRSGPSTPEQPLVATTSSAYHPVAADATLPEKAVLSGTNLLALQTPGIFGTDSGPPASRPNYASLGRAPPVLLA